jgi:ABC-type antimicrobial peptide transport system permease subunit
MTDIENKNMILSFDVTIKQLIGTSATFHCGESLYKMFHYNSIYEKGFYYNSNEHVNLITEFCKDDKFHLKSYIIDGVETMVKAVNIFVPIFELIAIILCVGIVFILVNFSIRMIQDKLHDIGILKALGTQNKSVGTIFGLQILLIAILTIIMSTIGYYYFVGIANDILVASLKEFATTSVVLELDFLVFKYEIVYIDIILIMALCILSLFIPMLKIKRIKPVKIIKTKE